MSIQTVCNSFGLEAQFNDRICCITKNFERETMVARDQV